LKDLLKLNKKISLKANKNILYYHYLCVNMLKDLKKGGEMHETGEIEKYR